MELQAVHRLILQQLHLQEYQQEMKMHQLVLKHPLKLELKHLSKVVWMVITFM
jgi:hypothetical protein